MNKTMAQWENSRKASFTKEVEHYRILRVESPFKFFLINDVHTKDCFFLSSKFKELQKIMSEKETTGQNTFIPLKRLKIGGFYATFEKVTKKWHRVRLLQVNDTSNSVHIFFCDLLLECDEVLIENLKELPLGMAIGHVVPVFRAHLYDVIPKDGSYNWDGEALKWFSEKLKKFSVWVGLQMTWSRRSLVDTSQHVIDVGIVLFQDDDEHRGSLNWEISRNGWGRAIGLGATNGSDLYVPRSEPFFSLVDLPLFPIIDYYNNKVPKWVQKRWPDVVIRNVTSPGCIYVCLRSKMEELKVMRNKIKEIFSEGGLNVDKEDLKLGYSCFFVHKKPMSEKVKIHRSVVMNVPGPNTAQILLVDDGQILTVQICTLYTMPSRFKDIPAFVHRVHMKSIRPLHGGEMRFTQWSELMNARFIDLIQRIERKNKTPAFYAVQSDTDVSKFDDCVSFRNVNAEPWYDHGKGKWVSLLIGEDHYAEYNDNPLTSSYLVSFGVDILINTESYNDIIKISRKWNFKSLSKMVAADPGRFDAGLLGERWDKKKYYRRLLKLNESR